MQLSVKVMQLGVRNQIKTKSKFRALLNEIKVWSLHYNCTHFSRPKMSISLCNLSLPCDEQLESGPGWPLIVWASDTFGAKPDFRASLITASTSDFHHSPAKYSNEVCLIPSLKIDQNMILLSSDSSPRIITASLCGVGNG